MLLTTASITLAVISIIAGIAGLWLIWEVDYSELNKTETKEYYAILSVSILIMLLAITILWHYTVGL